jgi:hypothetical protein
LIDRDGIHPLPAAPGVAHDLGYEDARGNLWLFSFAGDIWSGRFSTSGSSLSVARTATVGPTPGSPRAAAAVRTATATEFYVLAMDGTMRIFDGARWRSPRAWTPNVISGAVTALPDGEVVMLVPDTPNNVFRARHGEVVRAESIPFSGIPSGAAYVPGFGVLVGSSAGEVAADEDVGRWSLLGPGLDGVVYAFTAYEDGFFAGTDSGSLVQYTPRAGGFCPGSALGFPIGHLLPIGSDLIVLGDPLAAGEVNGVTYLERER